VHFSFGIVFVWHGLAFVVYWMIGGDGYESQLLGGMMRKLVSRKESSNMATGE
jgi:hypothetical protein